MNITIEPIGTKKFLSLIQREVAERHRELMEEVAIYAANNIATHSTYPLPDKKKACLDNIEEDVKKVIHPKTALIGKFIKAGRSKKQAAYFTYNVLPKDVNRVKRIAQSSRKPFMFDFNEDFEQLYLNHRKKSDGRTKKPSIFYITNNPKKIQTLIKKRQKLVGLSKSGWILPNSKKRFPSWISRHGANCILRLGADSFSITNPFYVGAKKTYDKDARRQIARAWKTAITKRNYKSK